MGYEIGSFIELQLPYGLEYYKGEKNIARLNSGRAAIYHAFVLTGCKAVWLPYYQCDTVRTFLMKKGVNIKYYHIDKAFNPADLVPDENDAVLFVNYYGIMSAERLRNLSRNYAHVIIDNSQAFFAIPLEGCFNVYSARKFVGVPDGSYVIGKCAEKYLNRYRKCYSSDTANFLLERLEYGCEGKTYKDRMLNEHRLDIEDILQMSDLTHKILDGTEYEKNKSIRKYNFKYAHELFADINCINPLQYYREDCVPMVYPLVVEDDSLLSRLLAAKHFQGHWWSYLLDELSEDTVENWLSRYIIPITIDQRYGKEELNYIAGVIKE